MPITRPQAREICTREEMELVESSFAPAINKLGSAQLRDGVTRARKLQDKYRDLARTQGRSAKDGATERRGTDAAGRTDRKSRLFVETRERFEKRLAKLADKG